jgi:hypothetical protein
VNTKSQQIVYFAELKISTAKTRTGIKNFKILKIGFPFRILEVKFLFRKIEKLLTFRIHPIFDNI